MAKMVKDGHDLAFNLFLSFYLSSSYCIKKNPFLFAVLFLQLGFSQRWEGANAPQPSLTPPCLCSGGFFPKSRISSGSAFRWFFGVHALPKNSNFWGTKNRNTPSLSAYRLALACRAAERSDAAFPWLIERLIIYHNSPQILENTWGADLWLGCIRLDNILRISKTTFQR